MQISVFLLVFLFNFGLVSAFDPDTRIVSVIDAIMHAPKHVSTREGRLVDLSTAVNQAVLDSALDRLEGFEAKEAYLREKISSSWPMLKLEKQRLIFLRQFLPTRETIREYQSFDWFRRDTLGSTEIMPAVDRLLGNPRLRTSTRLDKLNYLAAMIHRSELKCRLDYSDPDQKPHKVVREELRGEIVANWAEEIDESKREEILSGFGESFSSSRSRKRRSGE